MYFPSPTLEGIEEKLRSFLSCVLDRSEWLNSYPGHFIPRMKPMYLLNRRLGGPQSWSRHFVDEKNLLLLL